MFNKVMTYLDGVSSITKVIERLSEVDSERFQRFMSILVIN